MLQLTKHFTNLGFMVVAQPGGAWVKYSVYDIEGTREDGTLLWHRAGSPSYPDPVETLADAEQFLHGEVRWDGCSNWHFDEQDRGMLRGCCRSDVQRFGDILAACWDWTRELLTPEEADDNPD